LIMQAIFLLIGKWDYTVLLGNLWGASVMVLNFYTMGLFVQKAVVAQEDDAKKIMKLSHMLRTLALFALIVIGVVVPWCSTLAVIISLFLSHFAILCKAYKDNFNLKKEESAQDE
ncbi:MAG: hypothetical protein E7403_08070, partial [Ruminococcaceae bacterium]|nr:hypothetical protein [Oscillospiraceae bacterium]